MGSFEYAPVYLPRLVEFWVSALHSEHWMQVARDHDSHLFFRNVVDLPAVVREALLVEVSVFMNYWHNVFDF